MLTVLLVHFEVLLTKQFREHGNCIRGFTLDVDYVDKDFDTIQSFDTNILLAFLRCLSELRRLILEVWSLTSPFELGWISTHADTLESLYICTGSNLTEDDFPPAPHVLPAGDLRRFCTNFTKLKHLAVALPKVDLLVPESDETASYEAYLVRLFILPYETC